MSKTFDDFTQEEQKAVLARIDEAWATLSLKFPEARNKQNENNYREAMIAHFLDYGPGELHELMIAHQQTMQKSAPSYKVGKREFAGEEVDTQFAVFPPQHREAIDADIAERYLNHINSAARRNAGSIENPQEFKTASRAVWLESTPEERDELVAEHKKKSGAKAR